MLAAAAVQASGFADEASETLQTCGTTVATKSLCASHHFSMITQAETAVKTFYGENAQHAILNVCTYLPA